MKELTASDDVEEAAATSDLAGGACGLFGAGSSPNAARDDKNRMFVVHIKTSRVSSPKVMISIARFNTAAHRSATANQAERHHLCDHTLCRRTHLRCRITSDRRPSDRS